MTTDLASPQAPRLPRTSFLFVLHFARRYRGWLTLIVLLEIGASACAISVPYTIGAIVGSISAIAQPGRVFDDVYALLRSLYWPLALFAALNVGELLCSRANSACRIVVGPRLRTQVTSELFAYLQHHSSRFFSNNFAGALASRVSETATGVNMTIWMLVFDFLPVAVILLVSVALLWQANHALSLFVLVWSILFIGISYALAKRSRPLAQQFAASRSTTVGKLVDAVTNLSSIRLFARIGFERDYLHRYLDREVQSARNWLWANERNLWFQFAAAMVLKIGLLLFALVLWHAGRITVADLVMSVSLSLLIINEARNLGRRFVDLFEYIGNVANGVHTIVRDHDIEDVPHARALQVTHGAIDFCGVSFGYTPETKVFDNLTVRIAAGQRVGLVGSSGSGKSTFVGLILRQYDPQQGAVLIDNQDIRTVAQASLHRQVSLIPQDPGLFHRSLLENIRYGQPDAAREAVEDAARKARAHDFIVQVPGQYDSLVGERGVKLSGGQRQRISIARVIVKNAPILIMDEATSSLDSITEAAIQSGLDELMADKTVIVVAHRLSTIAHLDRILVFDRGRIVEDGAHADLLALQGAYARLWQRQIDGFLQEASVATDSV